MPPGTSDTQTAIDILKAENERLTGMVSTLTSERDKFKGDHDSAAKERDQLRTQVGNPDEHRKRADELEQKYRMLRHRQEFSRVAEASGVHRDVIDDLFDLSGYQPEKDDVDPKVFSDLLGELKAKKPRYFADPADASKAAAQQTTQQQQRHIAGAGRGGSHDPVKAGISVTRAQLADPKFMLNPKNKAIIASAAKEGRITD
jgi:hypothetical protein